MCRYSDLAAMGLAEGDRRERPLTRPPGALSTEPPRALRVSTQWAGLPPRFSRYSGPALRCIGCPPPAPHDMSPGCDHAIVPQVLVPARNLDARTKPPAGTRVTGSPFQDASLGPVNVPRRPSRHGRWSLRSIAHR